MQTDAEQRLVRCVEKPQTPELLDSLVLDKTSVDRLGIAGDQEYFLASMGIYLFNREVLFRALDNDFADFGKHIIPAAIPSQRALASVFQGYWEDIGTIRSFFEANLNLTSDLPRFNFFDMTAPIYTRPRFVPRVQGQRGVHGPRHHLRRVHHQPLPYLQQRDRGPVFGGHRESPDPHRRHGGRLL
jgi:glucose-1-phosphate adenylyltransferase